MRLLAARRPSGKTRRHFPERGTKLLLQERYTLGTAVVSTVPSRGTSFHSPFTV